MLEVNPNTNSCVATFMSAEEQKSSLMKNEGLLCTGNTAGIMERNVGH